MKRTIALAAAVLAFGLGGPASAAVTFFSVGAVGPAGVDPGKQPYETLLVDFEGANPGSYAGTTGVFQGTSGTAAAPAGDTTHYEGLGTGGSASYALSDFTLAGGGPITSLSAYLGSIDSYNYIDIFSGSTLLREIDGTELPASNGDQGAALTNRRIYINFAQADDVTDIVFRSTGVAFEFDDIAGSSARFNVTDGSSFTSMPPAVPEPASWAMMIGGFGLVGGAMRRRKAIAGLRLA